MFLKLKVADIKFVFQTQVCEDCGCENGKIEMTVFDLQNSGWPLCAECSEDLVCDYTVQVIHPMVEVKREQSTIMQVEGITYGVPRETGQSGSSWQIVKWWGNEVGALRTSSSSMLKPLKESYTFSAPIHAVPDTVKSSESETEGRLFVYADTIEEFVSNWNIVFPNGTPF
jgi:hypothetical protein